MQESVIDTERSSVGVKNRLLICIGALEPIFLGVNDPTSNNRLL